MDSLWVLVLILATPFAIVYMLILSKWRFSRTTTLLISALLIITITVFNFITIKDMAWMVVKYPILDLVCRLINITLEFIVALILTKQSKAQTIFIMMSMSLCVYIVDTIAITMNLLMGFDLASFIFKLILYVFMAILLYKLRRIFYDIAIYMKDRLWVLCIVQMVLFACSTMVVSYPVPLNYASQNIPLALMIGLADVSVYGIFLYIFRLIRKQNALESNAEAFHIYAASLEQQNEIIGKNAEKVAMFRHDLRHISQMLSVCAESGDIEGVKELIKHLDHNVSKGGGLSVTAITGQRMLDTVLNSYISHARESDIEIIINFTDVETLSVDFTEFAVVLANALENAIFACNKQPKEEKRTIQIDGRKKGRQFFFEIANTFSEEIMFDSDTDLPVNNEAGHGTGVKSISYFAEKSGAKLLFCTKGNWFHMRMLI